MARSHIGRGAGKVSDGRGAGKVSHGRGAGKVSHGRGGEVMARSHMEREDGWASQGTVASGSCFEVVSQYRKNKRMNIPRERNTISRSRNLFIFY
jgi:hypothetical protein